LVSTYDYIGIPIRISEENPLHLLGSLPVLLADLVPVNIHGHSASGVAEMVLDVSHAFALVEKERTAKVSQGIGGQLSDTRLPGNWD